MSVAWDRVQSIRKQEPWINPLLLSIVLGLIFSAVLGLASKHELSAPAHLLLLAFAALACGVAVGFVFAIPRMLAKGGAANGEGEAGKQRGPRGELITNSNLEEVSDWLTKIIVGVTLVEARKIAALLGTLADRVSRDLSDPILSASAVAALLIFFSITGFLLGYLWTRLSLTFEFNRVEREAVEAPEFLEGLVHALLYQPPPRGFEEAIKRGELYVELHGESNSRIFRSLACAYAQKYQYFLWRKDAQQELDESKAKALKYVQMAINIDPAEKESLRGLWSENAPPGEDDLKVFSKDGDFAKVLGDAQVPAMTSISGSVNSGT